MPGRRSPGAWSLSVLGESAGSAVGRWPSTPGSAPESHAAARPPPQVSLRSGVSSPGFGGGAASGRRDCEKSLRPVCPCGRKRWPQILLLGELIKNTVRDLHIDRKRGDAAQRVPGGRGRAREASSQGRGPAGERPGRAGSGRLRAGTGTASNRGESRRGAPAQPGTLQGDQGGGRGPLQVGDTAGEGGRRGPAACGSPQRGDRGCAEGG